MNALLFIIVALVWGIVWLPIKLAVSIMPPFSVAAIRLALALVTLLIIISWRKTLHPDRRTKRNCLILGVIGMGIPWLMLFWGQQYIYPGLSSIINSTVPLFVATFSWLLFRDRQELGAQKLMGIVCGFAGVLLIFTPELKAAIASGMTSNIKHLLGMLAVLGMAICYGMHIVLIKRLTIQLNHNMSLLYQSLSAFAVLSVAALLFERHTLAASMAHPQLPLAWLCIAYMGLIGSVLGLNCFFRLIARVGAVKAGTVTYLIPVVAILVDWLYFGHLPNRFEYLGTALIFIGLALVHFAPKGQPQSQNSLPKAA